MQSNSFPVRESKPQPPDTLGCVPRKVVIVANGPNLSNLPREIADLITIQLALNDLLSLRATCRALFDDTLTLCQNSVTTLTTDLSKKNLERADEVFLSSPLRNGITRLRIKALECNALGRGYNWNQTKNARHWVQDSPTLPLQSSDEQNVDRILHQLLTNALPRCLSFVVYPECFSANPYDFTVLKLPDPDRLKPFDALLILLNVVKTSGIKMKELHVPSAPPNGRLKFEKKIFLDERRLRIDPFWMRERKLREYPHVKALSLNLNTNCKFMCFDKLVSAFPNVEDLELNCGVYMSRNRDFLSGRLGPAPNEALTQLKLADLHVDQQKLRDYIYRFLRKLSSLELDNVHLADNPNASWPTFLRSFPVLMPDLRHLVLTDCGYYGLEECSSLLFRGCQDAALKLECEAFGVELWKGTREIGQIEYEGEDMKTMCRLLASATVFVTRKPSAEEGRWLKMINPAHYR